MAAAALPSTGGTPGSAVLCDTRDMLMIHSVFRNQFADAIRLVRAAPDAKVDRAGVLGAHVLEIAEALHHHHHTEDELLWDRLEQRAPSCAAHVGQMREQHARVAELLAVVEAAVPAWVASGNAADRDRVADSTQAVLDALVAHLGQEEADILPVAATTMTQKEWSELGERGRAQAPKGRLMVQLGTVLETTSPEYRQLVWGELPPPIKLLYRLFGRRQYEKHRALLDGTTP